MSVACSKDDPCGLCQTFVGPSQSKATFSMPKPPGRVGAWLLDGWWQANPLPVSPLRGLQYELGTRAVGELRRRRPTEPASAL